MFRGEWQKAIETLARHLTLPSAVWADERCASMRYIAPVSYTHLRARYRYTWSFRPDGSEGMVFWADKIHKNGCYRWASPVHETLAYTGEEMCIRDRFHTLRALEQRLPPSGIYT